MVDKFDMIGWKGGMWWVLALWMNIKGINKDFEGESHHKSVGLIQIGRVATIVVTTTRWTMSTIKCINPIIRGLKMTIMVIVNVSPKGHINATKLLFQGKSD
jgi:hypothetical protein